MMVGADGGGICGLLKLG